MRSALFVPPLVAWLFAASAAPLPAQEEKAKPPDPAMEALTALQKEFRLKLRDAGVSENAEEARAAAARPFLPRFQALAAEHVGTDVGLRSVRWVLDICRMTDDAAGWRTAFDAALQEYADNPAFASVVRGVGGPDAEKTLRRVLETSKNAEVKAAAQLSIGDLLWKDGEASGEDLEKATAAFEAVVQTYAGTKAEKEAKGNLNEIRNLQVGLKAPDISFTDLKGTAHKLSEYRGKVLLLNFWAPW